MGTLSQGELISSHHGLRSDLLLTATAAYLVELLDRMTEEKDPSPALYRLLSSTLDQLEEGTDPEILSRIFELKVLEAAGYRPVLDKCAFCGSRDRPVRFSVRQGGFLCSDCLHRDPHTLPLSETAARLLRLLQRITPDRIGEVRVKEETKASWSGFSGPLSTNMRASSSSPAPFWTSCAKIGPSRRIVDNRRLSSDIYKTTYHVHTACKAAVSGNEIRAAR